MILFFVVKFVIEVVFLGFYDFIVVFVFKYVYDWLGVCIDGVFFVYSGLDGIGGWLCLLFWFIYFLFLNILSFCN